MELLLVISEILVSQGLKDKAIDLLKKLNELNPSDLTIQARYLSLAAEIDFNTAIAFQQKLDQPDA